MSNLEEVLEMSDEKLEMEFEESFASLADELKSRIKNLVANTSNPIGVSSWSTNPTAACCCTIQSSSNACGGNGYLPDTTNCLPGGA